MILVHIYIQEAVFTLVFFTRNVSELYYNNSILPHLFIKQKFRCDNKILTRIGRDAIHLKDTTPKNVLKEKYKIYVLYFFVVCLEKKLIFQNETQHECKSKNDTLAPHYRGSNTKLF